MHWPHRNPGDKLNFQGNEATTVCRVRFQFLTTESARYVPNYIRQYGIVRADARHASLVARTTAGDTADRVGFRSPTLEREESLRSKNDLQRVDGETSGNGRQRATGVRGRLAWPDLGSYHAGSRGVRLKARLGSSHFLTHVTGRDPVCRQPSAADQAQKLTPRYVRELISWTRFTETTERRLPPTAQTTKPRLNEHQVRLSGFGA